MGQLILFPERQVGQSVPSIDKQLVLSSLRNAGLIAAASEDFDLPSGTAGEMARHYAAGPRFMQLLTFMGCMPFLVLDANEGKKHGIDGFCHLRWLDQSQPPWLLATRFSEARYRCPQCQGKGNYESDPSAWGGPWPGLQCPECKTDLDSTSLRWRRSGAIADCALMIWGIEPKEAVPSAELMGLLEAYSDGQVWSYCYLD